MDNKIIDTIKKICKSSDNDRSKMMDIVIAVQKSFGCVDNDAIDIIAKETGAHRVEVEGVVSFYAFFSKEKKGKVVIRLCNDIVDKMMGADDIAKALSDEAGINFGETTDDSVITLEHTPCIGISDQAPAALINNMVVTRLTVEKARQIVRQIKEQGTADNLVKDFGDGNNANELVQSMVVNNICKKGNVIFADHVADSGLKKALSLKPEGVIEEVKISRLRGRGGAGFPTAMKWNFTRLAAGERKYILCNADEGEPGTFKDRAILTECPDLLFEGMTIAGYAIGAYSGVLYLRGEYAYLRAFLESKLKERRDKGLLGNNILGKDGFNFDILIQSGAGAYICGEESALISSCEGLRGDPKTRPPFPAQKGYLGCPSAVNNVETYCSAARILENGGIWFSDIGTQASTGTKLLSISGDCEKPGVYEFPFGVKLSELLKEVGAKNTQAVLVGGPSGQFIAANEFERVICYDDLATGGAVVIFSDSRNILEVVLEYMKFFVEENCGYCTPCRVGNVLLEKRLDDIVKGKGEPSDLDYLQELGESIKTTSRCGLGQTSPNPILTTLKNFREKYVAVVKESKDGMQPSFDIKAGLKEAEEIAGRSSVIYKD